MNINTKEYWDDTYLSEIGKNEWRRYVVGFNKIKTYLGTIIQKNDTILDVGCGYGLLMDLLRPLNCDLTGYDISEVAIRAIINKGYKGHCINFTRYNPLKEETFSHVIATEFLEHVEDPASTFNKMYELAEKTIIFTVPDRESWNERCSEHLQVYNKERIKSLVKGFDLKRVYLEEYMEEFSFIANDRSCKLVKNRCLLTILEKKFPRSIHTAEIVKRVNFQEKPVDICVLCFSSDHTEEYDHFDIISRCLKSIVSKTHPHLYTLHIGCNNLSPRAMALVDQLVATYGATKYIGVPTRDIHGKMVYPKYPLMRKMYNSTNSEWVVWFDDDSYVVEPDWLEKLEETINRHPWADQFGKRLEFHFPTSEKGTIEWIKSATWYNSEKNFEYRNTPDGEVIVVPFIHGAFYAISRKAINVCNIPDIRIFHNRGDWTTGTALYHNDFKISHFLHGVVRDDALRRGMCDDKWCPIDEVGQPVVVRTEYSVSRDEMISRFIEDGENYFSKGRLQDAKNCFLNAMKLDPVNKEACNNLGVILYQQQDVKEAVKYFIKSIEIDPFYKEAVINVCNLLIPLGRLYEAKSFLDRVIERYRDDAELQELLKNVHLDLNRTAANGRGD